MMLAPKCLFGNSESTRRSWKAIYSAAWNAGSWRDALQAEEFSSLDELPGPIVVWNNELIVNVDRRFVPWRTDDSVWQFNWLLEQLPVDYEEVASRPEHQLQLVLDGLQHPWFAVGMLEGDPRFLPFLYIQFRVSNPTAAVKEEVIEPLLRCFLRWLPDLKTYSDRYAIADGRAGLAAAPLRTRLGLFIDLAYYAGFFDREEWFSPELRADDSILERMSQIYNSLA